MTFSTRRRFRPLAGILFLLALAWPTIVLAGITGKIAGRVTDAKKEPLPAANVVVAGTTLGAAADVDGYYAILNVPPGRYDLQFRLVGFRSTTVKGVQVTVNNTTTIDAVLEDESITTEAVVVTAKRPVVDVGLTSTVATISTSEIKALPVQELQDIVNLQAGVVDGHFRGGRADEVQYQVNGVSVNNVFDNKSSVRIDRSLIQEVQVITGTFDAEYGQAMSGVVNTVLKSGGESFEVNAEALSGGFVYPAGGLRNLDFTLRPTSMQNYQVSVSGPTGLPHTFFLLDGRRYMFDDYLWGKRVFSSTDSSDFQRVIPRPTGDGAALPLSYSREWSGLGKITNTSIPGVEISYQLLANSIEGRGLGGAFSWRVNPDGAKTQRTLSLIHGIDWTQTVSSSMFYTISVRQNYFRYTDWVYDDFYDPGYARAGQSKSFSDLYYGASVQGVDYGRYEQRTNTSLVKASVTSQVSRSHQLKAGGEFQVSDLKFGTAGTLTFLDVNGRQTLVRFVDQPPDYPGVKTYYPKSGAFYVHDMIEWNDLTIRAGVRFEYFDAHATLPSDLSNPADSIPGAPRSYQRWATKKFSVSPRFGLSYPITARSSIFFSYGHFYQLPALGDMFGNADYSRLARIQAGAVDYGVLGNPDVKPERTVQYEFGYKNAITDFLGLSLNLFYKDIRDLLGVEFIDTYTDAQYARLTNVDFGNVVGVTVSLDQRRIGLLSSTIDYTWQMATGNSSDPRETATLAAAGNDPRPRQVPLNWDQRHTLNVTLQLSEPNNFSVSAIIKYASGQPYTPALGSGFGSAIETNSGRKPNGLVVDMRAEKSFALEGVGFNLFARVFNLFNTTYFNGSVFPTTGSPDYSLVPTSDRNSLADPTRYLSPRRIEVGISMNTSL